MKWKFGVIISHGFKYRRFKFNLAALLRSGAIGGLNLKNGVYDVFDK